MINDFNVLILIFMLWTSFSGNSGQFIVFTYVVFKVKYVFVIFKLLNALGTLQIGTLHILFGRNLWKIPIRGWGWRSVFQMH